MTLEEAIQHSEEVMVENLEKTKGRNASDPIAINCAECAEEHRQLAEWLKDYKRLLKQDPILNKIRAEIAELDDTIYEYEGYYKAITDALEIIDKYRAESEGKE